MVSDFLAKIDATLQAKINRARDQYLAQYDRLRARYTDAQLEIAVDGQAKMDKGRFYTSRDVSTLLAKISDGITQKSSDRVREGLKSLIRRVSDVQDPTIRDEFGMVEYEIIPELKKAVAGQGWSMPDLTPPGALGVNM